MTTMQANESLYRLALSGVGAILLGTMGGVVGLAWVYAFDGSLWPATVLGTIAAFWGAVVVHLTPTGGRITENRTTVNYAVIALHAWYSVFLCILALLVYAIRSWLT
jgi:hypothetical protein